MSISVIRFPFLYWDLGVGVGVGVIGLDLVGLDFTRSLASRML